ncbi:MAG: hypothetical protein ABIJ00_11935, partial [Candidatus Eisenbacteria bacterium]
EYRFSLSDFQPEDEDMQETIRRNQDLISVTLTGRDYSELSTFAEAVRSERWIQRAHGCLSTIAEAHEDEATDEEVAEGDTTPV